MTTQASAPPSTPPPHTSTVQTRLRRIKHVLFVLSGKGGVGKSSVTAQLALSLHARGLSVGVLDIDLCGPSMPRMLGLDRKKVHQASAGWVPVFADKERRLCCMSIAFLLPSKNDSVVWRGPKKSAMIRQFLSDVCWGDLDYLLIDTPPGTSDEHISVVEYLKSYNPDGAVLVTTPQGVALADVRKELSFCRKVDIPILGVVENMSGYICPHCKDCANLFSTGGGEGLAQDFGVPFLGRVPIDPTLSLLMESEPSTAQTGADGPSDASDQLSNAFVERYHETEVSKVFAEIAEKLADGKTAR